MTNSKKLRILLDIMELEQKMVLLVSQLCELDDVRGIYEIEKDLNSYTQKLRDFVIKKIEDECLTDHSKSTTPSE